MDIDLPRTLRISSKERPVKLRPRRMTSPEVSCTGIRQQSHHGKHGQALAGTGFADDPEDLVRIHIERGAVHQPGHAAPRPGTSMTRLRTDRIGCVAKRRCVGHARQIRHHRAFTISADMSFSDVNDCE